MVGDGHIHTLLYLLLLLPYQHCSPSAMAGFYPSPCGLQRSAFLFYGHCITSKAIITWAVCPQSLIQQGSKNILQKVLQVKCFGLSFNLIH